MNIRISEFGYAFLGEEWRTDDISDVFADLDLALKRASEMINRMSVDKYNPKNWEHTPKYNASRAFYACYRHVGNRRNLMFLETQCDDIWEADAAHFAITGESKQ